MKEQEIYTEPFNISTVASVRERTLVWAAVLVGIVLLLQSGPAGAQALTQDDKIFINWYERNLSIITDHVDSLTETIRMWGLNNIKVSLDVLKDNVNLSLELIDRYEVDNLNLKEAQKHYKSSLLYLQKACDYIEKKDTNNFNTYLNKAINEQKIANQYFEKVPPVN